MRSLLVCLLVIFTEGFFIHACTLGVEARVESKATETPYSSSVPRSFSIKSLGPEIHSGNGGRTRNEIRHRSR